MAIARKPATAAKSAKPQRTAEAFIRAAGKSIEEPPVRRPFLIRVDDQLRERVAAAAAALGISQSQFFCEAAKERLKKVAKDGR
jgi:hypothetical protein